MSGGRKSRERWGASKNVRHTLQKLDLTMQVLIGK